MAVAVFVGFWVLLGLGLVLVAMRRDRGQRAEQRRSPTQRRRNMALGVTGLLVSILALGIGIPVAVTEAVDDRDSIPEAGVYNLTANEKEGRALFGEACANCHSLKAANAVAQVGPDLDQLRPPKALVLNAIQNGRARGNGQMAAQLLEGQEAQDVAAFVAKAVGQTP